MGLVQVKDKLENEAGSLDIEGSQIVWDAVIDKIAALYGPMTIDFIDTLFGQRFIVLFEGASC
ncbi:MAG TPA: hypothetical protein PKN04_16200 [bacterium]|jgi:hypothetical protein|nr:hypothetical protein [bacterium]HNT67328.1 hypothetical protein [bacterium]HOX86105.1 hypothetical protein [bacterium]HPG45681.1 hypothetical protein [bacterium]HPM97540.1 hypothetical protein [bacterium]